MKYLVCLVALLLLCLSPNPSFGQPNSSEVASLYFDVDRVLSAEVEDLYWKVLSVEEWPYEDYEKILGTLDDLYGKNKDRISHKIVFLFKVKDYINKLIKKKPHIVQELIGKIDELNKEITNVRKNHITLHIIDTLLRQNQLLRHSIDTLQQKQHSLRNRYSLRTRQLLRTLHLPLLYPEAEAEAEALQNLYLRRLLDTRLRTRIYPRLGMLLNALAAITLIVPDSSLEKYADRGLLKQIKYLIISEDISVGLGLLKPDQVEFMKRTRNHLAGYGFQFPTAKSESQGKSRSPSKSRKSRSTSERNEFEALAVT